MAGSAHKFINDLDQEMIVVDDIQLEVFALDDPRLWEDVLNWFEGDQLIIGNSNNPDHVARWQRWNDEMEKQSREHQYDIEIDVLPDYDCWQI